MAVKFKLEAAPTFKAKADIPVHGGEAVPVEFEFKHRTRDEMAKWLETSAGRSDVDSLLDVLVGWELSDSFGKESIERLVQNYCGAAPAIVARYVDELIQARRGN